MLLSPRHLRFVLRSVLGLAVLIGILLVSMGIFLRQNPEALARKISDAIQARTGLECSMGVVDVIMLPVPALALADVRLAGDFGECTIAYATVRPSLPALLTGSFEPGDITLLRPALALRLPLLPAQKNAAFPVLSELPPIPEVLDGCRITLLHGRAEIKSGDGHTLLFEDIRSDLRAYAPVTVQGWLSCGAAAAYREKTLLGTLEGLHLDLDGAVAALPRGASGALHVKGRLHIPPLLRTARVELHFIQTAETAGTPLLRAFRANLAGDLNLGAQPTPFLVQGSAETEDDGTLRVTVPEWHLGEDRLALNAVLTSRGTEPHLTGSLDVSRLSLSRWFGFARRLPPGLQRTLDGLSGSLEFEATPTGLTIPRLTATAASSTFTGTGGVARWSKPVIALNLKSAAVDLDTAFPEAAGRNVPPLRFAERPLTPIPGSPESESLPGPDIDYDIRLGATRLNWKGLMAGGCSFRCQPDKDDTVRLTLGIDSFYGGKGNATLLLGGDASTPTTYAIRAELNNIAVEQPLARLTGSDRIGGRLTGKADLTSRGSTAATFLQALGGTASLRLSDGFLVRSPDRNGKRGKFSFSLLELSTRTRSRNATTRSSEEAASVAYSGIWQGELRAPGVSASTRLDGPVIFSLKRSSMQLKKLSGTVRLELDKATSGLDGGLTAEIAGSFSFNSADNTLTVDDARATGAGLEMTGSATARFAPHSPELKGRLHARIGDLRRVLTRFDVLPPSVPRNMLRAAELAADVGLDADSLSLRNLRGSLDASRLTGYLEGTWKNRPLWKFDLSADTLNLDNYRGSPRPGTSPVPPKPWKPAVLRTFDLQGVVRCGTLWLHKLLFTDVRLPIRLDKGSLECTPIRGTLYGGSSRSSLRGEIGDAVKLVIDTDVSGVDMLRLTEGQGLRTVMTGRGSLNTRLRGTLRSLADIPAALDGAWNLGIRDGFLQSRTPQGRFTGSRTIFSFARASGTLEKGILRSGDVRLEGPNLRVAGAGWVNLVARTLDLTLRVTMYKIPEFPIRFYGSLAAPKSSVQTGRAIVDTLGNLGTGMLDAVGNVLGGALRLLR